eukprot:comp11570_c0_seq1/m.6046 comp11570_c0_seq1/g.6046  ORF comp11570_c0_seq1/g.6046 comp11570_c0_seq1/m.6046 type:complete len:122 (-) comp11570_c0_seq1:499-864(-)
MAVLTDAGRLYVDGNSIQTQTRESLVTLLDVAETVLRARELVMCLGPDISDRASAVKSLMFVGLRVIKPGSGLYPCCSDDVMFGCRFAGAYPAAPKVTPKPSTEKKTIRLVKRAPPVIQAG